MLRIQFKWGQKIESCPLCAAAAEGKALKMKNYNNEAILEISSATENIF